MLLSQMILFAYPSKPFLLTSKGSVRRGAVLELYRPEIEQAYEIFGLTTEIALPVAGNTEPNYHLLIDTILTEVLGESVGGLVDVFQQGCDRFAIGHILRLHPLKLYDQHTSNHDQKYDHRSLVTF